MSPCRRVGRAGCARLQAWPGSVGQEASAGLRVGPLRGEAPAGSCEARGHPAGRPEGGGERGRPVSASPCRGAGVRALVCRVCEEQPCGRLSNLGEVR